MSNLLNRTFLRMSLFLIAMALLTGTPLYAGGSVDMSAIPPSPKEERVLMRTVTMKIKEGFKLKRSQHYSIIYDTSEEDVAVFQRGIERTYRWCMRYAKSLGIPTVKPQTKLVTHFFDQFRDYAKYATIGRGSAVGPGTLGWYHPQTNYTYFYNYRNTPRYKNFRDNLERNMKRLQDQLLTASPEQKKAIREQIKQAKAVANFTLTDGGQVTEATLQHEVAHQVLFNIGFHNQRAALRGANPRWFAEGIASLFEPVGDGRASGFGALNEDRLDQYRALLRGRFGGLIPVDSFVANFYWFLQPDVGGRAYPQAWALLHYLTRKKRDQLIDYINDINSRTADYEYVPQQELAVFEKHFGKVDEQWTENFKKHMEGVR